MTIQEQRDELIDDYRGSHYNARGADHPAIKRRLDRDVEAFTADLDTLLLAVQDEQKQICAQAYSDASLGENGVYAVEIESAEYAYHPKQETA